MNNEEILKQDLITSLTLVGDRILIQLNEIEDYTVTKAGLYIPHNELEETEGGKIRTRPSGDKHYSVGKVLKLSDYSKNKLEELNVTVNEGDTVFVAKTALNSENFHFHLDRKQKVQTFTGLIAIPHTLIEAIYNDNHTTEHSN